MLSPIDPKNKNFKTDDLFQLTTAMVPTRVKVGFAIYALVCVGAGIGVLCLAWHFIAKFW